MNRHLSDDDVMRALAEMNPVPPGSTRSATEAIRREALLERITSTPPTGAAPFPRRRLGARIAALLGAIAVALAAVFGAASPATAESVLRDTAAAAATVSLGDGQYWHVRSQVQYPNLPQTTWELWQSDTRMLIRDSLPAAMAAAEKGTDTLDPNLIRVRDMTSSVEGDLPPRFGGDLRMTAQEIALLPTDPDELRRRILQRIDWRPYGDDYTVWDTVLGLLWTDPLSPAQRQAAWEVLADIGKARLLGEQTDAALSDRLL
ncbi:hypothetical protein ET495_05510 [Xylanimonas allomyrinae]|uniref:Uncharacterized protein n=1 Tax=Xylanimonas allomyrinae TaxID=2509459 RepID=A0A4P6EM50_9MICO|nr:hypothetical protein [Xylanimonas allomyrinae]QAY62803.1 hypothetical protein ET495_05510 [Xylanimonas allomyrinae]